MLAGLSRQLLLPFLLLLSVVAMAHGEGREARKGSTEWRAAYEASRQLVETLRAEVYAMKRIRAAQKELMGWNEERADLGLTTMTLRPELCLEKENERWCRLFPATFGVAEGRR